MMRSPLFQLAVFDIVVAGHRSILGGAIQIQCKLVISGGYVRRNRENLFVPESLHNVSINERNPGRAGRREVERKSGCAELFGMSRYAVRQKLYASAGTSGRSRARAKLRCTSACSECESEKSAGKVRLRATAVTHAQSNTAENMPARNRRAGFGGRSSRS